MKHLAILLATIGILSSSACDGDDITTPETPQLATGEWSGSATFGWLEMVLAEDAGGQITGAGSVRRVDGRFAFEVTGGNAFPNVSLTFRFGEDALDPATRVGAELINFQAEFDQDDDEIDLVGRLNGGVLFNSPLRLTRDD